MYKHIFFFILAISCLGCSAPSKNQKETADFDKELAQKLGADDYGMSQYVMAFLKRGPIDILTRK